MKPCCFHDHKSLWDYEEATTLQRHEEEPYLVYCLSKWPQKVAGQLPAKFTLRVSVKKYNETNIWSVVKISTLACYFACSPYDMPAIVMNISVPTKRYIRETHQPKSSTYAMLPHVRRWPDDRKTKSSIKSWWVLLQPQKQSVITCN